MHNEAFTRGRTALLLPSPAKSELPDQTDIGVRQFVQSVARVSVSTPHLGQTTVEACVGPFEADFRQYRQTKKNVMRSAIPNENNVSMKANLQVGSPSPSPC